MTRALLLLSLLCGGCLVVPAKKVTTTPAPNVLGTPVFGTATSVDLSATVVAARVSVHAIQHGRCSRSVYGVTQVTTERKAKLGGADDPRAMVFGLVLAPVTIPLSAIITGFILAGDDPQTKLETKLLGTERFACSQAGAHVAVQVSLPSGGMLHGQTDAQGDASFTIPMTESYVGSVGLVAEGAAPSQVAYAMPRPAITVARDAVTECATQQGITGAIELKVRINDAGRATRLWLSLGDAKLEACVGQRLAGLKFPQKTWDHTIKMPLTIAAAAASL